MENPKPKKKEFNTILLYLLIGLMILTGSTNTIATKIQTRLTGLGVLYEQHQWFITYGMFIGEMFSLIGYLVYIIKKRQKVKAQINDDQLIDNGETDTRKHEHEEEKPEASNFIFASTAMCDLCATTLNTFGLTYLSSSIYQMFRGFELLFIMLFSKIFLKNKIYRHHILGVGSVILGLFFVGLTAVIYKSDAAGESKNPFAGMAFLFCAQFFSSTQYTIQEKLVKNYSVNSFQLVGFEGLWGATIYTLMLVVFQQVDCSGWSESLQAFCIKNEKGEWHLEDALFAFRQMGDNHVLLGVVILHVTSIALYNFVGINLTQLVSSTARAIVDTVRTVFVWLFFLIPWDFGIIGIREYFYVLQFFGFMLLISGTIIYNEIIELNFCGLDKYTRTQIAKREKEGIPENDEEKDNRLFRESDTAGTQEPEKPTNE